MNDSNARLTRRDLLASSLMTSMAAAVIGASDAAAQPLNNMPSTSKELWQWFRTQPVLDLQRTYLDVASAGPTLRAAMAAEYRIRDSQSLNIAGMTDEQWASESTRMATSFANYIGCDPEEILFTRGTGEALATAAFGLDLNAGDEVLTTNREHPAALSPWLLLARRRGIVVKQVELPAPINSPQQAVELFAGAGGLAIGMSNSGFHHAAVVERDHNACETFRENQRDYEELKQELGLGHYEGRGWRGFHHHATLCIAAYGFLVSERNRFSPSARAGHVGLSVPRPPPEFRPRGSPRSPRAA